MKNFANTIMAAAIGFAVLATSFHSASAAFARPVVENNETRKALVIGNGNYQSISKLLNPVNDARAIAAKLLLLGFDDVVVRTDVSLSAMNDALTAFEKSAEGADVALVFYAGSSFALNGEIRLAGVDLRVSGFERAMADTVGLDSIVEPLRRTAARTVVIVDGCAEEPFADRPAKKPDAATRDAPAGQNLERSGVFVALAAEPGTLAQDGAGGDSPFTTALLKALDEPGASVDDVMSRVRWDVFKVTEGRQRPWSSSTLLGPEPLVLNRASPR